MATEYGDRVSNAEKFLDAVDTDPTLREKLTQSQAIVNLAKEHDFHFSNDDLKQALQRKWGHPEKRKGHPDPYTCCCFSETPGF